MNIHMKSPWLVAALVAAGVTVAGAAMARGECADAPRAEHAERVSMMKERHAEHVSGRFDALAESLKLRDDQKPAWQAFRAGLSEGPRAEERVRRDSAATAPERMQRMEQAMEGRLEHMRRMRALTEDLYAVLDEDQRKQFDQQGHGGRERGHEQGLHKHHGHGHG